MNLQLQVLNTKKSYSDSYVFGPWPWPSRPRSFKQRPPSVPLAFQIVQRPYASFIFNNRSLTFYRGLGPFYWVLLPLLRSYNAKDRYNVNITKYYGHKTLYNVNERLLNLKDAQGCMKNTKLIFNFFSGLSI